MQLSAIKFIGSVEELKTKPTIESVSKLERQSQIPMQPLRSPPSYLYQNDLLASETVDAISLYADDDKIVIVTSWKLLVYDNEHRFQYTIDAPHMAWDITRLQGTNIYPITCYCLDFIHFIDIKDRCTVNSVEIEDSMECGITASKDKIFVGRKHRIGILNYNGKLEKNIDIKNDTPNFIALGRNNTMCYITLTKVVCIRLNGDVVFSFPMKSNDNPGKLAVDNIGYIYAMGVGSGIHRFKPDGAYVDTILREETVSTIHRQGVCLNTSFSKLYAIHKGGVRVSSFKRTDEDSSFKEDKLKSSLV